MHSLISFDKQCSIDTLLDLTIKHMVFMQSLAKYADRLKEPYEPKVIYRSVVSNDESKTQVFVY